MSYVSVNFIYSCLFFFPIIHSILRMSRWKMRPFPPPATLVLFWSWSCPLFPPPLNIWLSFHLSIFGCPFFLTQYPTAHIFNNLSMSRCKMHLFTSFHFLTNLQNEAARQFFMSKSISKQRFRYHFDCSIVNALF